VEDSTLMLALTSARVYVKFVARFSHAAGTMVTSGLSMFGFRRILTWAISSDLASCLFSPGG
jgi:hypothetical protein